MDVVVKITAIACLAALIAGIIKRGSAEMSLLFELAAVFAIVSIAVSLASPIVEVIDKAQVMSGMSQSVISPVIKCVFIAIIARIASDMCKDSGQAAMANAVEFSGAIGAVYVALPLVSTLLDMLGDLL